MNPKLIICAVVAILFPAVVSAQLITSAQTITVKENTVPLTHINHSDKGVITIGASAC